MNLNEIRVAMKQLGDPDKAAHAQGFFKTGPGQYGEGDIFLGIRVPETRKMARLCHGLTTKQIATLLHSKYHEERLLALLVMIWQFSHSDLNRQHIIYDIYLGNTQYINNWDLVDVSAHYIVGPWLENRPRKILVPLAQSEMLWDRRIAMMATFHFIRKNDYQDALIIVEMLVHDEHDLIHKAVGWMLREIGNRDRAVEEAFLLQYYRKMPRTMLRYAIEKFPEPLRLQYLKGLYCAPENVSGP